MVDVGAAEDRPARGDADVVIDTMATARTIRRFTDEPVPDELVERLVFAATRASSGRNSQPWTFVAIRDRETLRAFADELRPRAAELRRAAERTADVSRRRMFRQTADLMGALPTVPVVILVAGRLIRWGPPFDDAEVLHSALFAASQNLIVAARALGLGAAFTTLHLHAERTLRERTGLPDHLHIATTIPVGWPAQRFGPVRRRPVAEVLHWDRYRGDG
ncbi:MAG TPA: nitroreductase family protein [Acidimicrobiales bacterium]